MPTPTKGPRLGGGPAHERLILANLATALFEHDSITTTEAKAKRLRPLAERLVTFAKRGDLHARRRVMTVVRDKGVVHRLFVEIAPDMAERQGGYTRITKIGPRKGDNAPMAVIELVREPVAKKATVKEAEGATKRAAKQAAATEAAAKTKAAEDAETPEWTEVPAEDAEASEATPHRGRGDDRGPGRRGRGHRGRRGEVRGLTPRPRHADGPGSHEGAGPVAVCPAFPLPRAEGRGQPGSRSPWRRGHPGCAGAPAARKAEVSGSGGRAGGWRGRGPSGRHTRSGGSRSRRGR